MTKGRDRFLDSLRKMGKPSGSLSMPKPDDQWGVWVEYRLDRLESQQLWLMRLLVGSLAVQVGLKVIEML